MEITFFTFSIFCVKNGLLVFFAQLANTIVVVAVFVYFMFSESFYMFMMQNTLKILIYPFVPKSTYWGSNKYLSIKVTYKFDSTVFILL